MPGKFGVLLPGLACLLIVFVFLKRTQNKRPDDIGRYTK